MPRRAAGARQIVQFAQELTDTYGRRTAADLFGVSRSSLNAILRGKGLRSRYGVKRWRERAFGAQEKLILTWIEADNGIKVRFVPSADIMQILFPNSGRYMKTYNTAEEAANDLASTTAHGYLVIVGTPRGFVEIWDDDMSRHTNRAR